MASAGRKAKLLPDLVGTKPVVPAGDRVAASAGEGSAGPASPASPIASLAVVAKRLSLSGSGAAVGGQAVLCRKGAATAQTFQPSYWSYDAKSRGEGSRPDPAPISAVTLETEDIAPSAPTAEDPSGIAEPAAASAPEDVREAEDTAARQILAAGLAEMIESVLRTHQFAALIACKVRYRSLEIPQSPMPPIEPSVGGEAIGADVLRADPSPAIPVAAATVRTAEPWIDRVLGLVGFAMVVPACFFAFSLWQSDARETPQSRPAAVSSSPFSAVSLSAIAPEARRTSPDLFGSANEIGTGMSDSNPARNKLTK
jgi:hypothetical protein